MDKIAYPGIGGFRIFNIIIKKYIHILLEIYLFFGRIKDKRQQKSIKLIDGELLAELLVRYEVGVLPAQNIKIYKIDTDYFNS